MRRQAAGFTSRGLRAAFDADHEAVLMTVARRDRLDAAIGETAADTTNTLRHVGSTMSRQRQPIQLPILSQQMSM